MTDGRHVKRTIRGRDIMYENDDTLPDRGARMARRERGPTGYKSHLDTLLQFTSSRKY